VKSFFALVGDRFFHSTFLTSKNLFKEMTRCKGRCADGTKCLFEALSGNYGFCKHHRGRKSPNAKKKIPASPKLKLNVKKVKTKRVPWKCTGNGCRPSAGFWGANGMRLGSLVEYNGKTMKLKKDINGRHFWSQKL
jgi:hypothetical protein